MNWTKIAVLTLIMVIFITVGLFGSAMGYSVSGVDVLRTAQTVDISGSEWTPYYLTGSDEIVYWYNNITGEMIPNEPPGGVSGMMGYLWSLLSFQLDGVPVFLALIFWIMILIFFYILFTSFTPFLPGGG